MILPGGIFITEAQGLNEIETSPAKQILKENGLFDLLYEIKKIEDPNRLQLPAIREMARKLSEQLPERCTFLAVMERKDNESEQCLNTLEKCFDSPGLFKKIRDHICLLSMCCSRFLVLRDEIRKDAFASENTHLRIFLFAMADYIDEIWG